MRVLLVLVAACSFEPHQAISTGGMDAGDAGLPADAVDAPLRFDGPPGQCFGSGNFTVCLATLPTTNTLVGPGTLDTTACTFANAQIVDQPTGSLCAVAGTGLTVQGAIFATGSRPLVLVATSGNVVIGGTVDVSSHSDGTLGAGANASGCDPSGKGGDSGGGGGGGAGGSFGTAGAAGGDGKIGAGGMPGMTTAADFVRGGCVGGAGGFGGIGGKGGNGGGAVYVVATGDINVQAPVDASGEGGRAATGMKAGGGGGGSGGLIALFAGNNINLGAEMFANGGGAGGGTDNGGALPGAESSGFDVIGGGGAGASNGGDGAIEGFAATPGGPSDKGAGGGGGGLGVIKVVSGQSISGQLSPAAS